MQCNSRPVKCRPVDIRYPVILLWMSCVRKLIIKQCHEDGHHSTGTNYTLAESSTKYWIISASEVVKRGLLFGLLLIEGIPCRQRKAKLAIY